MFRFKGINHLAMVTSDMDATIRFWRDLLGLKLAGGHGNERFKQYLFEICPGSFLSFHWWPGVEKIAEKDAGRTFVGAIAFDHVALEVEDADALWAIKDRIDAADEWVSEVVDNGFIHSIFVFDPNNISVEICHGVEGVDPARDFVMADRNPTARALEGPAPRFAEWPAVTNPTPPDERPVYEGDFKQIVVGHDAWRDREV